MGPIAGGGWLERGPLDEYLAAGGPVLVFGLQRTGSNAFQNLMRGKSRIPCTSDADSSGGGGGRKQLFFAAATTTATPVTYHYEHP